MGRVRKLDYNVHVALEQRKSKVWMICSFVLAALCLVLSIVGSLYKLKTMMTICYILTFVLVLVSGFLYNIYKSFDKLYVKCAKCKDVDITAKINVTNSKEFKSLTQVKTFTCNKCGNEWDNDLYDETK